MKIIFSSPLRDPTAAIMTLRMHTGAAGDPDNCSKRHLLKVHLGKSTNSKDAKIESTNGIEKNRDINFDAAFGIKVGNY